MDASQSFPLDTDFESEQDYMATDDIFENVDFNYFLNTPWDPQLHSDTAASTNIVLAEMAKITTNLPDVSVCGEDQVQNQQARTIVAPTPAHAIAPINADFPTTAQAVCQLATEWGYRRASGVIVLPRDKVVAFGREVKVRVPTNVGAPVTTDNTPTSDWYKVADVLRRQDWVVLSPTKSEYWAVLVPPE